MTVLSLVLQVHANDISGEMTGLRDSSRMPRAAAGGLFHRDPHSDEARVLDLVTEEDFRVDLRKAHLELRRLLVCLFVFETGS